MPLLLPEKLSPEAIIGNQAWWAFAQGLARGGMWKPRGGDHSLVKVRRVLTLGCGVVAQHVGAPAGKEGSHVRDGAAREDRIHTGALST